LLRDAQDLGQLITTKAFGPSYCDRFKPELGITLGLLDVYMRRFFPFQTKEKEPVASNP